MSCSLSQHCSFSNLKQLKHILFPEEKTDEEILRDDDYDNRWNWDEVPKTSTSTSPYDEAYPSLALSSSNKPELTPNWWLSLCLTSISPFGDLIVFARQTYLAIYRRKVDVNSDRSDKNEAILTYSTCLSGLEPKEKITSVLCVPFVSKQRSSSGSPDWTCIIIGFSSGYIRIYTEVGDLLLTQILHDERVMSIKCQTFAIGLGSQHDQTDEILLVYPTATVLIDGFALSQTLRACRNQLAKTQSTSFGLMGGLMNSVSDNAFSLTYKKWKLEGESRDSHINDCENVGVYGKNVFDHLVSQSISRGPFGHPRSKTPSGNLLITTGENPYVGLYCAHEGATLTILNELTQAVMNKVKNMIPISIFGSKQAEDSSRPNVKIEPATPISPHLEYFDLNREGLRISVAPTRRLAAICDDFGRVTLMDVDKMIAIRMWKGYRDAEVGWIEVPEDSIETATTKKALFLTIYAPKRGILEIWCCSMGPRVSAFNVGKSCKLIQCSYSMIGLNTILIEQYKSFPDFHKSRCFLFDFSSCTLFNIHVPFVCCLTDRNSKQTRDLHLLKELKSMIKDKLIKVDKLIQIVLAFKTAKVRREVLETFVEIDDLELIRRVANEMKSQLIVSFKNNELDYENQLVTQMCCRIIELCDFYEHISHFEFNPNPVIKESSAHPDIQDLVEKFNWKGTDIVRCLSLLALRNSINSRKFSIEDKKEMNICKFLSFFTLYSNQLVKDKSNQIIFENISCEVKFGIGNALKSNLKDLSDFIFLNMFLSNFEKADELFIKSHIAPMNLLQMMFISWLTSNCYNYWKCWEYFNDSLNIIFKLLENEILEMQVEDEDSSELMLSWKEVIDYICDSTNIPASILAAHFIQVSGNSFLQKKEEENLSIQQASSEEWEDLCVDKEKLSSLIKQLEDVFLLDLLLKSNQKSCDMQDFLSLGLLIKGGPAIVSELVAKWAIDEGIQPDVLCTQFEDILPSEAKEDSQPQVMMERLVMGEEAVEDDKLDISTTKELLDHVRRCFPNCLEPDVLLANCAWELLVRWEKDISSNSCELIKASLAYLFQISSAVLKHNVACLIWKTFMQKRFESLAHLMEKMGKTPKDRIAKKEVGMGENCIEIFLEFVCELLEFILQTNMMAEIEPMPLFTIDEWWKTKYSNNMSASNVSAPLVILAVHQKVSNAALVLEHCRLASAMLFITSFQLKSCKPISLLSPIVHAYLFKDLHSFPAYTSNSDPLLSERRTTHILSVVSAIALSIPVFSKNQGDEDEEMIKNQSKTHSQANKWFGKVVTLAREWELNIDEVRRHFVCQLYLNGSDSLGEENLTSVQNLNALGIQLMRIAGMRMLIVINEKFGTLEQMPTIPPNVLFWLKSLTIDNHCYSDSSLQSTLALLEHINNYVHHDQTNGKICQGLIDVIKNL